MNDKKKQFLILVRCCICMGCSFGIITNCLGIFFSPIAAQLGVGRGDVALMSTIMSLSSAAAIQVIAKLLNRRFPINILMGAGAVLAIASVVIMSMAKSIMVFYVCGALLGIGYSCYANLPVSILLRSWYGEKNASKLGIAMAFSGLCAAIANPIMGRFISTGGFESGFRVMAIMLIVLSLPATFTMKLKEEPAAEGTAASGKDGKAVTGTVIAASTMLLLVLNAAAISTETGMNSHFSSAAISLGYTLAFSATVASFQNVFNSVWKLLYGFFIEKIGLVKSTVLYLCINMAGSALILGLNKVPAAFIAGVSMYATAFGISTVGCTIMLQKIAKERYAEVYATMNLVQTLGYAFFTWAYGSISDKAGNYLPCLIIAIAASACCAVVFTMLGRKAEKTA
jgi:MFS family permease